MITRDVAQRIGETCQAPHGVKGVDVAGPTRAGTARDLPLGGVAETALQSIRLRDREQRTGRHIPLVVRLAAEGIDACEQSTTAIEAALRGAAVGLLPLDYAPEASLALEVVDAHTPQAVGNGRRIVRVVEAVGQGTLPQLLDHLACGAVDIAHGRPAGMGMCRHTAHHLWMVLKRSALACVAPEHGDQFTLRAVFVAHQWLLGDVGVEGVLGQIHSGQAHARIRAPTTGTLVGEARKPLEFQAVVATGPILYRDHAAVRIPLEPLRMAKPIIEPQQLQALAGYVTSSGGRTQHPPGAERIVGDEEERRIAPVAFVQTHPRDVQAGNR